MVPNWKLNELLTLVRARYPEWEDFSHAGFQEDECAGKRATAVRVRELLNRETFDALLAKGEFATINQRLLAAAHDNTLLWRQVPGVGDTALLNHPHLDLPAFCAQVRNLLYGDRPSPQRLASFTSYCGEQDLPQKWPFPTYLLFFTHPDQEYFVKPRTARWFLKFMLDPNTEQTPGDLLPTLPTAASYDQLLQEVQRLRRALNDRDPRDMIDIQSLIWVAETVSREKRGGLDKKGQVELDVPRSIPPPLPARNDVPAAAGQIAEPASPYATVANGPESLAACAQQIGRSPEEVSRWLDALARKGQLIFFGPPGTGKTYIARTLAQYLVRRQGGIWQLLQFHPGYAYEDFIQGIRPQAMAGGTLQYQLQPGHFLRFCRQAAQEEGTAVLILDEINRANLAAVFGELLVGLEYRETAVPLAGGGELQVPANLRLIGTMNSADRSIALVDHALRRRFAFIQLAPDYALLQQTATPQFDPRPLIALLQTINRQIGDPHSAIGHTYFLSHDLERHLPEIWQLEIEPYLDELFFDQPQLAADFRWDRVKKGLGFD